MTRGTRSCRPGPSRRRRRRRRHSDPGLGRGRARGTARRSGKLMRRNGVAVAALAAAVLLQLTFVNGLPLPGGGAPDLVLLCVVALGLTGGPQAGLVAGFLAGLALDLAPPASEIVGQYALVLCLAGYLGGKLRLTVRRSASMAVVASALVMAAGEAMAAALVLA